MAPTTTTDKRRRGDDRPFKNDKALTFLGNGAEPTRWLPKQGEPFCIIEWVSQKTIRALAYLPIYTAIVVTIIVLIQVFGLPWGG